MQQQKGRVQTSVSGHTAGNNAKQK